MGANGDKQVCSVCLGTGQAGAGDAKCICQGSGLASDELANLRAMAEALRSIFQEVQVRLTLMGYNCSLPSQILPAIEKLYQRCTDAEEEFVKLKRQRVK